MSRCPDCPVPEDRVCGCEVQPDRFPYFREWAASGCPVKRRTIVAVSAMIEGEPPIPGPLQRATNFAGAVVAHVAAGMPTASPEQQQARLAICRACENFTDGRCRLCGCSLELKAGWADQSCPLDPPKWGPITSPSGL